MGVELNGRENNTAALERELSRERESSAGGTDSPRFPQVTECCQHYGNRFSRLQFSLLRIHIHKIINKEKLCKEEIKDVFV